jgi:LacI family fructose operon transcriptional repressor
LKTLPAAELERCAFGCYDYDPFASMLSFPLLMVRQNIEGLLAEAFRIIDRKAFAERRVIEIKPDLVFMHELRAAMPSDLRTTAAAGADS